MPRVHLVVDRAFRAIDWQLPTNEPVWIVDTAANKPYVTESQRNRPGQDHRTGVSTFTDSPDSTPEVLAARMLPVIELHHGEYSANPPYDSLHVIGARKSAELLAGTSIMGLVEVIGQDFDFECRVPNDASGSR
jgi:hypothetical protein